VAIERIMNNFKVQTSKKLCLIFDKKYSILEGTLLENKLLVNELNSEMVQLSFVRLECATSNEYGSFQIAFCYFRNLKPVSASYNYF
jgi:hypothetical protein